MVAIVHALWMDQVGDPARREMETTQMRQAVTALLNDERFIANVLTCGDGLAVGFIVRLSRRAIVLPFEGTF